MSEVLIPSNDEDVLSCRSQWLEIYQVSYGLFQDMTKLIECIRLDNPAGEMWMGQLEKG